jgi:hypothetical protein
MGNIFSHTRTTIGFLPDGYAGHGYPLPSLATAIVSPSDEPFPLNQTIRDEEEAAIGRPIRAELPRRAHHSPAQFYSHTLLHLSTLKPMGWAGFPTWVSNAPPETAGPTQLSTSPSSPSPPAKGWGRRCR